MSKKLKKELSELSKKFEEEKDKKFYSDFKDLWMVDQKKDPLEIVRNFIKKKGLKLYGGLALHNHLKKKKEPIYKNSEFPDYDVFSPNAWEHAKELCDILFKSGFYFVEAKSSILNDEHHQTYKVSVDMIYVLDLTQIGCTVNQINKSDCSKCSVGEKDVCVSIFNHIPAFDIRYSTKDKNPKEYKETFDYKTNQGIYKNKMFVCSPDWLKISMYREITEPLANPSRLEKVTLRLNKFNKHFKLSKKKCKKNDIYLEPKKFEEEYMNIVKTVARFVETNKLINYGASAYNLFIRNNKMKLPEINIADYEVYADGIDDTNDSIQFKLLDLLKMSHPKYVFKIQEKIYYWKEVDSDNYIIYAKKRNSKQPYKKLITFTQIQECMPYIQYNGIKYATIDRIKHVYLRAIALPEIYKIIETDPYNYKCLLQNLLSIEKKAKKSKKGKFKKFVLKCEGSQYPKIWGNLMSRFKNKIEQTKKTKIKINYPKKGYITKSYPLPKDNSVFPYKPAELQHKKYKYF